MKYKFFGQPNMLVKERKKKYFSGEIIQKPLFRFDEKGEYITDDERIIEKLKSRFDHVPYEEPKTEGIKVYKCNKCKFETENKGDLLAHYRKHKKEE